MLDLNEYLERAIYCRQMAERAHTELAKANWLRLAEAWMALARWYGGGGGGLSAAIAKEVAVPVAALI